MRIPGIPIDVSGELSVPDQMEGNDDSTDSSAASGNIESASEDNELDEEGNDTDIEVEFSTVRPYVRPSKKPLSPMHDNRPGNETTSSKRPNEFYDDEIFGFDPYQTFHHGVYVPLVEAIQPLSDTIDSSEEVYIPPPTNKNKRRKRPRPNQPSRPNNNVRPFVKNTKPTKARPAAKDPKRPIANLPDYLHRPRPSHLQYQHG